MKSERLRKGYTTGSCAAAATKAALQMLLGEEEIQVVSLITPNQTQLYLDVEHIIRTEECVQCGIRKDAGDDPDVTNGIVVFASVKKTKQGVRIDGGAGVGRITRKGLQQAIGEAAINKVPRQMIEQEVYNLCQKYGYKGGIEVVISIPDGIALATKTFNPRLGIVGGISVLGTTGVVEPMSEKALIDTIYVELKFLKENEHDYCYVVPGNYGSAFLTEELCYDLNHSVKCSNYIGETISCAKELQMKGILLIGHIGKFVKLAAGIMNTHSRIADGRMEVLAAHAALNGARQEVVRDLMQCVTTLEALEILSKHQILGITMHSVMHKIEEHLKHRAGEELMIGAIVFSEDYGVLGQTTEVEELIRNIKKNQR